MAGWPADQAALGLACNVCMNAVKEQGIGEQLSLQQTEKDELKDEFKNTAYLAHSSLVRLKPSENFITSCADARHVGGTVYEKAYASRSAYDEFLDLFDEDEATLLRQEIEASPLPWYCVASDTKDNVGTVRIFYAGQDFSTKSRTLLVRQMHKVNHDNMATLLAESVAVANLDLKAPVYLTKLVLHSVHSTYLCQVNVFRNTP